MFDSASVNSVLVPVHQNLPFEHGIELLRDPLEQFLDCRQVSDEGWPGNFRHVVTPGMVFDTRWFRSLYVRSNVPLILMVIKWNKEDIVKLPQQLHPLYYYYILIALKVSFLPLIITFLICLNSVSLQNVYKYSGVYFTTTVSLNPTLNKQIKWEGSVLFKVLYTTWIVDNTKIPAARAPLSRASQSFVHNLVGLIALTLPTRDAAISAKQTLLLAWMTRMSTNII